MFGGVGLRKFTQLLVIFGSTFYAVITTTACEVCVGTESNVKKVTIKPKTTCYYKGSKYFVEGDKNNHKNFGGSVFISLTTHI